MWDSRVKYPLSEAPQGFLNNIHISEMRHVGQYYISLFLLVSKFFLSGLQI